MYLHFIQLIMWGIKLFILDVLNFALFTTVFIRPQKIDVMKMKCRIWLKNRKKNKIVSCLLLKTRISRETVDMTDERFNYYPGTGHFILSKLYLFNKGEETFNKNYMLSY